MTEPARAALTLAERCKADELLLLNYSTKVGHIQEAKMCSFFAYIPPHKALPAMAALCVLGSGRWRCMILLGSQKMSAFWIRLS